MSHQLHNSLVRILSTDGNPVGIGFVAADNLLLTCAHVTQQAVGDDENVSFDLPLLTPGESFSGRVLFINEEQDIATIEATVLPQNTKPLLLGNSQSSRGHSFLSHGVPRTEQVLTSSGTITGYATLNSIQYLQLESSQVTPGFSGAPVFDEATKRVVGMVIAIAPPDEYQRQGTTAFAVPAETLREVCGLALSDLCPYRSLDAFTEADANLFFGRERVVAKLLENLKRNPRFLAVLGPSGSGKSSVVQAGLLPALRKGKLSGSEKWGILSTRPGTQPFEQLASAGMSDPLHLVQAASDWLSAHPQHERLLILIDQFEELLVSTPSDMRAEFVAALADLLDSSLPVTVLLTLRDDFYNRFTQEAGDLVDWMEAALVNIPPTLEEAELREIIARPARDLGLVFAPGLVDAILADVRTADPSGRSIRSTVLPLLEFALNQLWERREEGELTHDAYRAMGGVTGGLSQWADRAYYALDDGQRAIARRVFSELVTLGDETQGIADTRRVRSIAELTAKDGEGTKTVLNALVAARLLVARHDESSGQDTVEIIHETLLREWGLLEDWLQDDRQFLLWREGLRTSQQAWQESGQDAGALLRGIPLAEAEGWLGKRYGDLAKKEINFIQFSVALQEQEQLEEEQRQQRELEQERKLRQLTEKQAESLRELARDMHDKALGKMAAVAMRAELIRLLLEKNETDKALDEVITVRDLTISANKEIRGILNEMAPEIVNTEGLIPSLEKWIERENQTANLNVNIYNRGYTGELKPDAEAIVYNAILTGIRNIRQHTNVTVVQIRFEIQEKTLAIEIEDNNTDKLTYDQPVSLGQINMKDRIDLVGGSLLVKSEQGKGTIVCINIPLENPLKTT